jgi:hypothetical protein
MSELECLSRAVSAIFEHGQIIRAQEIECGVVGFSFEPAEKLLPAWELAVSTACELSPWLTEVDPEDNWSTCWGISLFTPDGLWEFPERQS